MVEGVLEHRLSVRGEEVVIHETPGVSGIKLLVLGDFIEKIHKE